MRESFAVLVLLIATAVPAPAAADVRRGPPGAAFYTPPSPLPGDEHGDPVWVRRQTGPDALDGARSRRLLLYRSTGVNGKPVAVSGTLSLPNGRAPAGGWPVITYGHGTTGNGDACAPTRGYDTDGLVSYPYPLLNRWLKAGYALVRTDYEGQGTPGVHPFLVGRSEGRSMLDIVRAAIALEPRLGRRVVIAGHSQGGHAALWAASLAPKWTPELRVRGTVAFAPASHLAEQGELVRAVTTPSSLSAFAAIILRGVEAARPKLDLSRLLGQRAAALYPDTLTRCYGELSRPDSFGGLAPAEVFRPDADLTPFLEAVARSDPERLAIRTPVRVDQGTADTTVLPPFTAQLVEVYRNRGIKTTYETYEGVSHRDVVAAAATNATRWIRARLARRGPG
jgi:pimeloyl-ACP methyl ester carboxylesterase